MKHKKVVDMTGEIYIRCCEGRLEARRNVPTWVCRKCGERYHHAYVYKKMRQVAAHSDQITEHVSVPITRYWEGEVA